jgi:ATP adenylyltransferase
MEPNPSHAGAVMPPSSTRLQTGTLRAAIGRATQLALASGSLQPIDTEQEEIEDCGVRFLVRLVSSLARKAERHAGLQQTEPADPFLPYDPSLFVADISPTHVALLNKFPLLDHHTLIVTRAFEPQETLMHAGDFAALAACMVEFEALGFYNGGRAAGASQDHKHLQLVPCPLARGRTELPIEPLLRHARRSGSVGGVPGLPFRHASAVLAAEIWARSESTGESLTRIYRDLCRAAGIEGLEVRGQLQQSGAYNLLLTREWMLLVPRSRECWASISVNALGFAGSLFVKDKVQLERVRSTGPMSVLKQVALPA